MLYGRAMTATLHVVFGPSGAGKSTLAEALAAHYGALAQIVPMDGFHLANAELARLGRAGRKGAPDTFDVGGLRSALARLRDPAEGPVAVPVFDRDLEISRGSARIIGPEARLILAEGNYLTLDADPWRSLRPCFDATVLIDVPEAELRRRLRQRWLGYKLTEAEIDFKLDQNDLPNGRVVAQSGGSVDYILHTD